MLAFPKDKEEGGFTDLDFCSMCMSVTTSATAVLAICNDPANPVRWHEPTVAVIPIQSPLIAFTWGEVLVTARRALELLDNIHESGPWWQLDIIRYGPRRVGDPSKIHLAFLKSVQPQEDWWLVGQDEWIMEKERALFTVTASPRNGSSMEGSADGVDTVRTVNAVAMAHSKGRNTDMIM